MRELLEITVLAVKVLFLAFVFFLTLPLLAGFFIYTSLMSRKHIPNFGKLP